MIPGDMESKYIEAKCHHLNGNFLLAHQSIVSSIQHNPTDLLYLLQAQIELGMKKPKQAMASLESALALNFKVRDMTLFYILKTQCQKLSMSPIGSLIGFLKQALYLPDMVSKNSLNSIEKLELYHELSSLYKENKMFDEANKCLCEALTLYPLSGAQEVELKLKLVELEGVRGFSIENSLKILETINQDTFSAEDYLQAKYKVAELYLKIKNDKTMFIKCYQDIAEKFPNSGEVWISLGDAHLEIGNIDESIKVFESVQIKFKELSKSAASKIGQALVRAHRFQKAIKYYEGQNMGEFSELRYDLAKLYRKLKLYDGVEKIFFHLTEAKSNAIKIDIVKSNNAENLRYVIKCLILLSEVYCVTSRKKAISSYLLTEELLMYKTLL